MASKLLTKNGHDLYEMTSLLQKAIRRGHDVYAGYAACELMYRYPNVLWKRLIIISAEDCWDCVTHEIVALKNLYAEKKEPLYVARALTILLRARKNRDADWYACNLLNSRDVLNLEEAERNFDRIPDYTYDCHTLRGKLQGKTKADMIKTEQQALFPHVEGYYDRLSWDRFFYMEKNGFYQKDNMTPPPPKDVIKEAENGAVQMTLFDD